MGFEAAHLFREVEVHAQVTGTALLEFSTELPGQRMAEVYERTFGGTAAQDTWRVRLPGTTKGHLYRLRVTAVSGSVKLFGARVLARRLGGVANWQWYGAALPETPRGYGTEALPIPATAATWGVAGLPIAQTPDEFSKVALSIPQTPDGFGAVALPVAGTPSVYAEAQLPVERTPDGFQENRVAMRETPPVFSWVEIPLDAAA